MGTVYARAVRVLGRMEFITSRPHPNLTNEAF